MKRFSMKKMLSAMLVTTAVAAAATASASACTTLYVGGKLTEEGTPFVARTEDYGSDMNKLWMISQAGQFKEGSTYVGCPAYGAFEWTFTHDSYRFTHFTNDVFYNGVCPECGEGSKESPVTHLSYTEFGTNEMGVSVSATETLYGNGKANAKEVDPFRQTKVDGKVGIEETDIPTILLAEAASARDGVKLLLKIYDEYGAYFASGVFICDQNEVWYVENCSGTQYVAVKLNDNMIFLEPNLAVIGRIDLDDTENVIASERLIEVAKQAGTFVGNEAENIIDFRASYAPRDTVGAPRMVDGLNFLNENYRVTEEILKKDNGRFTISNLNEREQIVPLYTNIRADRKLTKDDVFNYYKLSSIGKASNQEIEIFQLFKDRPVETGTVGWVGMGNMSYNVFIPYYPMLLEDMYEGYQVSTPEVVRSKSRPEGFCTWTSRNGGQYVAYPENWRDSYYFTFEGLGGYIAEAGHIDGAPVSQETRQYVLDKLDALQQRIYRQFDEMRPQNTTVVGKQMARSAHQLGLELIDYVLAQQTQVQDTPFQDVPKDSWYYRAVVYTQNKKLMNGVRANAFAPGEQVTRSMMAQILYNLAGRPSVDGTAVGQQFQDVNRDVWYADAVYWARAKGIVSGYSSSQFGPNDPVTREQLALMLYQYAGRPNRGAHVIMDFADKDSISSYAMEAMEWAVDHHILSGKAGSRLDPKGPATRAEAAQVIMKFDLLNR